jgi:aspartyl/asparaginyl beta-hydroxylase (cupin superfamily)
MEARLIKNAILRLNNSLRPYPSLFYFPGIRSSPFWNKDDFKSAKILEENYNIIKDEYFKSKEISNGSSIENDYKLSDHEKHLHQGNWEWFSYISKGTKQESFKNHFPKTNDILDSLDDKIENLPFSYCFFSKLAPNSNINAHYGPCNIRVRIHLGLDVPPDCHLSVAEKKVQWEEGKCIAFDDTYLHEVKNENKERHRVILLLDVWHPDIKVEERQAIVDMFKGAYEKGWLKK